MSVRLFVSSNTSAHRDFSNLQLQPTRKACVRVHNALYDVLMLMYEAFFSLDLLYIGLGILVLKLPQILYIWHIQPIYYLPSKKKNLASSRGNMAENSWIGKFLDSWKHNDILFFGNVVCKNSEWEEESEMYSEYNIQIFGASLPH